MADSLFNWRQQNPQATPEEQQAALSVFNGIDNSQIPDAYSFDTPSQPVQADTPAQAPAQESPGVLQSIGDWFTTDKSPQTQGYENADPGSYVPQSNKTAGGFLDNLASLFQNPAFLQSAMAFGDSMAGNQSGFEKNMNAYAQTMDARRQDQAKVQQAKLARTQQLADIDSQRNWQDKAAKRDSLYRMYTPESVDAYIQGGETDPSVLVQPAITPYQQAVIDINQQKADTQATSADARNTAALAKNLNNLPASFGDDADHEPKQNADGVWMINEPNSKGQYTGYKVAGPQQQKVLDAKKTANSPSAGEVQMNGDLKLLSDAIDADNVGSFTGQAVGRSQTLQDIGSSLVGNDSARQAYRAAERINGMMITQGVGNAKDLGASGINTIAEAKMYFAAMPRLDYTSPQALKESIGQIQAYTQKYNASKRTAPSTTQAAAPTGGIPTGWSVSKN